MAQRYLAVLVPLLMKQTEKVLLVCDAPHPEPEDPLKLYQYYTQGAAITEVGK